IDASLDAGAHIIELHTGNYANAKAISKQRAELERIKEATEYAIKKGFTVNAGHGLNYKNVKPIVRIEGINELNIGHSIVSYAVFVGIFEAVSKMRELIK
ncbi:MAG: pyridoxine 5'-phosphate synthase, partial [Candidatus Omnitrophica bacterium]|nr:pyridoxine 5'-phosphate synthase [Candidatus Omnitrophota bacterium]